MLKKLSRTLKKIKKSAISKVKKVSRAITRSTSKRVKKSYRDVYNAAISNTSAARRLLREKAQYLTDEEYHDLLWHIENEEWDEDHSD